MSLFLISQHSFFFKDFFPSFLTHITNHSNKNLLRHIDKKKKKSKILFLTWLLQSKQKQALVPVLKSPCPSHSPLQSAAVSSYHFPDTKPCRAARSMRAQFSPQLSSQAFPPDELGRKRGSWFRDTCSHVQD